MRKNEYKCLDDFINEYNMKFEKGDEFHIGIDFSYKNKQYRVCYEPIGAYYVYKVNKSKKKKDKKSLLPIMPDFITLGICKTMDELLYSKFIGNIEFEKVIMDDETIIEGKD